MLAQKPGVDDLPFVPAPRLEVEKRRSPVLKVEIKLERVTPRRAPRRDRLALQPAIPFPDDQSPQILLFHFLRAQN